MTKVMCATLDSLPPTLDNDMRYFSLFKSAGRQGVGNIARGWKGELNRSGFAPDTATWDFVQFCLSVCAADLACLRNTSADGWTRTIDLTVALDEPTSWVPLTAHIESMLKVLTGDYWTLHFIDGGAPPPVGPAQQQSHDCVCLLSGGLDSLIGAIDLVSGGRRPMFVSQKANEDSQRQTWFAQLLGGGGNHRQWSHGIGFNGEREPSTRGRSLGFYAFAVLAASQVAATPVQVFVPENGFISVNPPLVPGRVSSLSTRTTHPLFMAKLQQLFDALGVGVKLELPYRFKTKGQMLDECADQCLLRKCATSTTSCGRFLSNKRKHCGRCVPCMIRKAAFLAAWGKGKDSTQYVHPILRGSDKSSHPDDPMAAALAVVSVRDQGLDRFLGATLAFASPADRPHYRRMLRDGFAELESLLRRDRLL